MSDKRSRVADLVLRSSGPDREALASSPPAVLIDNVATYMAEGTDQNEWLESRDFPNVTPPFPLFWLEWKGAQRIRTASGTEEAWSRGLRFGALVRTFDADGLTSVDLGNGYSFLVSGARFVCLANLYVAGPEIRGVSHPGAMAWGSMPDGRLVADTRWSGKPTVLPNARAFVREGDGHELVGNEDLLDHDVAVDVVNVLRRSFLPGFLAISFMHCRNVEMDPVEPHPKRKTRPAKQPRVGTRFHTLRIEPMKRVMRAEAGESTGVRQALHICRGHFKDYTARGLFGRGDLKGRFWWPMSLRGSKEQGEIRKDYAVDAPSPHAPATEPSVARGTGG